MMLADLHNGKVTAMREERRRTAARVDLKEKIHWIDDGKEFLWLSEPGRPGGTSIGSDAMEEARPC